MVRTNAGNALDSEGAKLSKKRLRHPEILLLATPCKNCIVTIVLRKRGNISTISVNSKNHMDQTTRWTFAPLNVFIPDPWGFSGPYGDLPLMRRRLGWDFALRCSG